MMKYDALASLGAAGIMDIDALAQWISKSFSKKYFALLSLVFTSDISISKMTKDKFSSEVYEDKAGRIFF